METVWIAVTLHAVTPIADVHQARGIARQALLGILLLHAPLTDKAEAERQQADSAEVPHACAFLCWSCNVNLVLFLSPAVSRLRKG